MKKIEFKNARVTIETIEGVSIVTIKENIEVEKEEHVMSLSLSEDKTLLHILVGSIIVANLTDKGIFSLFKGEMMLDALSNWRKNGMKVDASIISAFGREFRIDESYYYFKERITCGEIFDFERMTSMVDCESDAVIKYEGTKTPIVY